MSVEEKKAIIRRWVEAVNKQDLSLLDDLMAPNYFDHTRQEGMESYKKHLTMFYTGFPDYHVTIEDIIAEGDKVCVFGIFAGTNTGEYLGLAPTGKNISVKSITIKRIVDGKMVEGWTVNDMVDFFNKLGIIEATEKGKQLFPEDAK